MMNAAMDLTLTSIWAVTYCSALWDFKKSKKKKNQNHCTLKWIVCSLGQNTTSRAIHFQSYVSVSDEVLFEQVTRWWWIQSQEIPKHYSRTQELTLDRSTLCLHLILSKMLDLFPIFSLCSDYLNIRLCFIWDSVHMEPIPTVPCSVWMAASLSMRFLFFILEKQLLLCMVELRRSPATAARKRTCSCLHNGIIYYRTALLPNFLTLFFLEHTMTGCLDCMF